MIQGVYEKDGEKTVFIGNGLIEIEPVPSEKRINLHAITGALKAKKRKPHRRIDHFTPAQAVFSGMAWGLPIGIMTCVAMATWGVFRWASIVSIAVFVLWVWQNYWRKH